MFDCDNSGTIPGTPYLLSDKDDFVCLTFRMARIACVEAPGIPHHATQGGNRRRKTFFHGADYQIYLEMMSAWRAMYKVEIWADCFMPNHVHPVAGHETKDSLNRKSERRPRSLLRGSSLLRSARPTDATACASIFVRNGAGMYGPEILAFIPA